jgi:hypothetical protein
VTAVSTKFVDIVNFASIDLRSPPEIAARKQVDGMLYQYFEGPVNITETTARRSTPVESGPESSRRGLSAFRWLGCSCLLLLLTLVTSPASAEEFIDLVIPLRDGRFYTLRDVCAECNRKLQTARLLDQVEDREYELTFPAKLALMAADRAELIRAKFESDRLVLSIPNAQDAQVRRQNRRRLERLLGITLADWPAGKGLHLPPDFDPAARTLLLIHGLEGSAADLERFRLACCNWGIQAIVFDYPNDAPLAWSGDRLALELKELTKKYPSLRMSIVAHSMGGLVARHALEVSLQSGSGVTDVFFLGTPHRGSSLAVAQPVLELALPLLQGSGFGIDMLSDGLGEAGDDLRPGSEFLKQLGKARRVAGVRYHVAIGKKSFITPEQGLGLVRQVQTVFERLRVPKNLETQMLGFLQSDELQSGKGDGAVSVTSARLDGTDNEKQFDLNHLQLLSLPGAQPEDSPIFRWTVETLGWAKGMPKGVQAR